MCCPYCDFYLWEMVVMVTIVVTGAVDVIVIMVIVKGMLVAKVMVIMVA